MDVVFALEKIRIIIDSLYLNCSMKQAVLTPTQICYFSEGLKRIVRFNMHYHAQFSLGNLPYVKVMNVDNII